MPKPPLTDGCDHTRFEFVPETFTDTSPAHAGAHGVPRRVLVVDDSALVREAARVALAAMPGWEVLLADCGEEALALAESVRPDAILLDVVMPGMDGLAVAEQLQARGLARTSSVVFLTGMHELEERQASLPAVGVIAKPFAIDALPRQLASLLGWQT
jgi:CheY-like chemotaxis protein